MNEIRFRRLDTTTTKIIAAETILRLIQMLMVNAALSMIIMSLNVIGLISTQQHIFASTCAGVVLSAIINIQLLRNLYYKLANKFEYYTSAYIAQILFFAVNVSASVIFDNGVYAWFFSVTKFARFSHLMMESLTSAIIFNIVMLFTIHLAPLGMGWLVVDEDYEYDE